EEPVEAGHEALVSRAIQARRERPSRLRLDLRPGHGGLCFAGGLDLAGGLGDGLLVQTLGFFTLLATPRFGRLGSGLLCGVGLLAGFPLFVLQRPEARLRLGERLGVASLLLCLERGLEFLALTAQRADL